MTTSRNRVPVAVALLAALPVSAGLGGCSNGGGEQLTPAQAMTAAKRTLDRTSGVHLTLSTDHLPRGVSGLLAADGVGTHDPAFKGSIKVVASGISADAKVIATGGAVYAVLPFTTKYVRIKPKDYGAPDPATLMDTQGGLSSLLTRARDLTAGKQTRDGKQVVEAYSGTVPGSAVAAVIPSADSTAAFDATFEVGGDHRLHRATLTGPFYPTGGNVTYTVTFDDYGAHPQIKAP